MRVSVLRGPKDIVLDERQDPVPGPFEVLVRVRSVGVCGSDVHYYTHGRIGSFVVSAPLVLGHEAAGEVVALGAGASRVDVGARVSLEPGVPDLTCEQCRAGRYNLCPAMRFFATPPVDGAFAELVTIHELFAHPVPARVGDDAAALLEPLSVGLWAVRKAGVAPGARVLVTGAGPVGLVTVQAALAYGASEVVVTDVSPGRLECARRLGATRTLDVGEARLVDAGVEADVLLECSGRPDAVVEGIGCLARAGSAVLVGMGSADVGLPLAAVQERELTVTGTFRYAHTWPEAIALVAAGKVDLDALVTGHYGLADVEQALTAAMDDPHVVKPVVRPQE